MYHLSNALDGRVLDVGCLQLLSLRAELKSSFTNIPQRLCVPIHYRHILR
jgi:hypothetical protein